MQPAASATARPRYNQAQMEQFISAHERYHRREPRGRRAVMRFVQAPSIDFSRRVLVEADFTGADFQNACFALADLERAALFCADMRGADARGANLRRADLRGCSLRQANLTAAKLDGADMREAVLARADMEGGFRLAGRSGGVPVDGSLGRSFAVDFSNCSMKGVKLNQCKLKGANFSGAILHGADLSGAILDGARFDGAVLIDANLSSARIDHGALANCVLDPTPTSVQRVAELMQRLVSAARWIATNGKEGLPARLDGEDLRPMGEAFEKAQLTALSAKGACAIGVGFAGAQLQGAKFDNADLRDADFTGADLRGASFHGANLNHAQFAAADMRPLALASGVRTVDLTEASHGEDAFVAARRE